MVVKFSLESALIEGFKGFTSAQEIRFDGLPTFIFGPNMGGKTSILEAISWCIFGLDPGHEPEIRNRDYYSGDCKVELTLTRNGEKLKIIRTLRRTSGTSDAYVITPTGEKKGITEVFPQLRKLKAEGTSVIFAHQGTVHRFVGDLKKFKEVINVHLGLERIDELRALLSGEAKDQEENHYKKQIVPVWNDFEKNVNDKIKKVEEEIESIRTDPPWENEPPSAFATKTKIMALFREVSNFLGRTIEESMFDLPMERIVEQISEMLKSPTSVGELEETIGKKKQQKSSLEDMKRSYKNVLEEIDRAQENIQSCRNEMNNILSGRTIEELDGKTDELRKESEYLLQELNDASSAYLKAQENRSSQVPIIERLVDIQDQISRQELELETLTKESPAIELTKQLEELEAKENKLGEYLKLINIANEYCSKHTYTQCPVCESNSQFNQKFQQKMSAVPAEISNIIARKKSLGDRIEKINNLKNTLEGLKNNMTELLQPMSEHLTQVLSDLNAEKQKLIEEEVKARSKYEHLSREIPEKRNKIQNEINSLTQLQEKVNNLKSKIQSFDAQLTVFTNNKRTLVEDIRKALVLPVDTEIDIQKVEDTIHNMGQVILSLERELEVKSTGLNTYKTRLREIKKEVRYHQLLKLRLDLMEFKLSEGWHEVEEQIAKFGDLLRSIKNIEDGLGNAYLKMFNEYLTPVEQKVQEVYRILTGQISYPDIRVLVKSPEEIEMEVGISGGDLWRKPSEVLNEQAKNAIELVPYFAFSELGMLHHDLDFLLIDDPSRSFDIEHLEFLMNMFKSVSKNAQIIVATQEKEKFEGPVKELFPTVKILEIGRLDPHTGPKVMGGSI